ncbi:L,D-transpeptidase family protein [Litchfieldella rifensis]|uniref:L,D-transpeptidase family protein n=1 Tax=Litchfieldella rifensis TaxID=762643 RepID=A0ABV7LM66_9GAMM
MPKSLLVALTATFLLIATSTQAGMHRLASSVATIAPTIEETISLWSELAAIELPKVAPEEVWVRIDLKRRELALFQGEHRILTIPYLAFGTAGANRIRLQGSSQTPIGEFRIDRINRQSRFKLFFGIDYPTPDIVHEAWRNGILTDRDYRDYRIYRRQHGRSPAHTPLGGHIGIHGLGNRPVRFHQIRDWTEGCIAVTNAEIQMLERWLDVGTLVVIR